MPPLEPRQVPRQAHLAVPLVLPHRAHLARLIHRVVPLLEDRLLALLAPRAPLALLVAPLAPLAHLVAPRLAAAAALRAEVQFTPAAADASTKF